MPPQVERHKVICERMSFMAARRSIRLLRDVTAEWKRLTKLHLPRKLRLLQVAPCQRRGQTGMRLGMS